jgi:MFS transporter, DHA1 family, multidrug resistance protein
MSSPPPPTPGVRTGAEQTSVDANTLATRAVSAALVAGVVGVMLGLQPVVTDLFLPALPTIRRELDAPMQTTQRTMWGLLLAFGFGQLVWGPVSDRVGRRPVLLAGLAMLTLAAVGSSTSPSMTALVAWRVAQGLSLAAVVVTARAVVRDVFEPTQGAIVMSKAMSVLGLAAIVSPVLGGSAAVLLGWRPALLGVAVAAALALVVVWRKLPETSRARDAKALHLRPMLRQMGVTLRHPTFVAYALLVGCTYGGLFTFLSASSFVFIDILALTPLQYGAVMAVVSIVYLAGTLACRQSVRRRGVVATVRLGALFTIAGGVSMLALALSNVHTVWAVLIPQCLYSFGHGIHQPCGQSGALAPFPRAAGVASALTGACLSLAAVGAGWWLGRAMDGTTVPMAVSIGAWSLATSSVALTLVRRHGDTARFDASLSS